MKTLQIFVLTTVAAMAAYGTPIYRNVATRGARAATGLRVDFLRSQVPESGETAVMMLGLGLALYLCQRKRPVSVPSA